MQDITGDTAILTFVVSNARRIDSKTLFAMVDVEVQLAGVAFLIQGVQARRLPQAGTSIHLPTFKDIDGGPKTAIILPDEVREPLTDAVLAFLMEEGLARPRCGRAS
jgi:stage V sporulation protein G